jgi:hypothetical protein
MIKQKTILGVSMLLPFAEQAATVLWDGTGSDITSLSSNIDSTNNWAVADTVWSTTDRTINSPGTPGDPG